MRIVGWESWERVLGEKEEEVLLVRLCSEGCEGREPGEQEEMEEVITRVYSSLYRVRIMNDPGGKLSYM